MPQEMRARLSCQDGTRGPGAPHRAVTKEVVPPLADIPEFDPDPQTPKDMPFEIRLPASIVPEVIAQPVRCAIADDQAHLPVCLDPGVYRHDARGRPVQNGQTVTGHAQQYDSQKHHGLFS